MPAVRRRMGQSGARLLRCLEWNASTSMDTTALRSSPAPCAASEWRRDASGRTEAVRCAVLQVPRRGRPWAGDASRQHRLRGARLAFPRDERRGVGPDHGQPAPVVRLLPRGAAVNGGTAFRVHRQHGGTCLAAGESRSGRWGTAADAANAGTGAGQLGRTSTGERWPSAFQANDRQPCARFCVERPVSR